MKIQYLGFLPLIFFVIYGIGTFMDTSPWWKSSTFGEIMENGVRGFLTGFLMCVLSLFIILGLYWALN